MITIDAPQKRKSSETVGSDGRVIRTRSEERWIRGGAKRGEVEAHLRAAGFIGGSPYVNEAALVYDGACTLRTASLEEHGPDDGTAKAFRLALEYSTETAEKKEESEDNPLAEPPEVSWGEQRGTRVAERDRHGKWLLNAVGLPYATAPEIPVSFDELTITRNQLVYNPGVYRGYKNKINSHAFYGADPGTLRCDSITAKRAHKSGLLYWVATFVFAFDPDGWDPKLLEADIYELDSGGYRIPILDKKGGEVSTPVPITAAGKAIHPGDLPAAAVTTEYELYHRVDFRKIGI